MNDLLKDLERHAFSHFIKTSGIASALRTGADSISSGVGKDIVETGALGALAVPEIARLTGHPMKQDNADVTDVAALGALSLPSVINLAKHARGAL